MNILQNARRLEAGTYIELFKAEINAGGFTSLYFHNYDTPDAHGPGTLPGQISFGGNIFSPAPIEAEGFETSELGAQPTPHLKISNWESSITALLLATSDLSGAVFTRFVTLAEHLDGGSGPAGQCMIPDIYKMERVVAETREQVEIELLSTVSFQGALIPGRIIQANSCWWDFRDENCGFTGLLPLINDAGVNMAPATDRGAYNAGTAYGLTEAVYVMVRGIRRYYVSLAGGAFTNKYPPNNPAYWGAAVCRKRVADCKRHHGAANRLPYGGFAGTNLLPNV